MKKSVFNDSIDRVFNYALSYKSARARFKKNPAELITDGYAIQVFKPIVDTLPKEVKDDLHTKFGSQAKYGFFYFHLEYVITSRITLFTTVSIFPAETLANYHRRTGSVDSKVSHKESANHNLSKSSYKLEERQPSGSLIQKFKDRFKEGVCLACGAGKFSLDHECKAIKFYQEEAKNFVKSSEFKQLKSNQKVNFKDSPKSKMPSGDSRSKALGEPDRKDTKGNVLAINPKRIDIYLIFYGVIKPLNGVGPGMSLTILPDTQNSISAFDGLLFSTFYDIKKTCLSHRMLY